MPFKGERTDGWKKSPSHVTSHDGNVHPSGFRSTTLRVGEDGTRLCVMASLAPRGVQTPLMVSLGPAGFGLRSQTGAWQKPYEFWFTLNGTRHSAESYAVADAFLVLCPRRSRKAREGEGRQELHCSRGCLRIWLDAVYNTETPRTGLGNIPKKERFLCRLPTPGLLRKYQSLCLHRRKKILHFFF